MTERTPTCSPTCYLCCGASSRHLAARCVRPPPLTAASARGPGSEEVAPTGPLSASLASAFPALPRALPSAPAWITTPIPAGTVQLLPQVRPDHGISDTSFFTLFAQNFTLGPGPAQQVAEHKYSPGQRTSISDPRPPVPHVAGAAGSPGAPLAAHPASRLLPGDPAPHPLPPGQVSTSQPRLQGLRGLGQGGPQTPWGA